jgi:HK97 family phage major capsid protein
MAADTTTAPELTTEQVATLLVQPLEAASVVLAAGPCIFDTSRPLRIPKLTGSAAPDWIGEGEQITEKDLTFDELTLLPDTLKSVKVISR